MQLSLLKNNIVYLTPEYQSDNSDNKNKKIK